MRIQVNGEPRDVAKGLTLLALIDLLALPRTRVAVELNQMVVRRSEWEQTILKKDDRVEIVHFVGGGSQFRVVRSRLRNRS